MYFLSGSSDVEDTFHDIRHELYLYVKEISDITNHVLLFVIGVQRNVDEDVDWNVKLRVY
jgi:hypothetical protein